MTRVLDVSDHGVTHVDVMIALARLDRGDVGNDPFLHATIRSLFNDGRLLRIVEVPDTSVTVDVAVRLSATTPAGRGARPQSPREYVRKAAPQMPSSSAAPR